MCWGAWKEEEEEENDDDDDDDDEDAVADKKKTSRRKPREFSRMRIAHLCQTGFHGKIAFLCVRVATHFVSLCVSALCVVAK